MIPAQAVDAAARELYARDGYNPWELEEDSVREKYLRKVTHILEAAAPYMAAATLREAADGLKGAAGVRRWLLTLASSIDKPTP